MSKKIDLRVLNARQMDFEVMIKEAKWLESLNVNGRSTESIEKDVKKFLNFGDEESVIAKADEKVVEYNLLKNSLIKINKLTGELNSGNLISQEEGILLGAIERRLAEKVKGIYNLDDEDLYEEALKQPEVQ